MRSKARGPPASSWPRAIRKPVSIKKKTCLQAKPTTRRPEARDVTDCENKPKLTRHNGNEWALRRMLSSADRVRPFVHVMPRSGGLEALPMIQRVKVRASFTDVNRTLSEFKVIRRFSLGCYFDLARCCDLRAGCIFCSCFKENVK